MIGDEYTQWSNWYYGNVCIYPWFDEIEEGNFVVLDVSGVDVGLMGSENALGAKIKGARGFLTNGGGIRDTDEVIQEEIPVWSYFVSQKMDQVRLQYDAKDVPVAIGGVTRYYCCRWRRCDCRAQKDSKGCGEIRSQRVIQ